ncbi:NAD(+) synthase [Pikeienuella piscinae]|uniref:Glutamine-dependent NAD(+) synthetase n=1 Tax=Pikeienuella piscinae TaxID=2748098 RepID=A0A7L5C386_9RHOB|nr:NAD(+) synthase [Pikeienuella piscinae]QIE56329.1 NAD(+) synthase [Pikeienuella piscinae]
MPETGRFSNIYAQGFARVATATPRVLVGDPAANLAATVEMAARAHEAGAALVVFPELGLTGYAIDDLLQQEVVLSGAERAAAGLIESSEAWTPLLFAGLPLRVAGRLYNVAAAIHRGRLLGIVPKTYLPNYREFYERRHFTSGAEATTDSATIAGHEAAFGTDLIFTAEDFPDMKVGVEICEDVWVPVPPSAAAAMAGATVIANLSASNVTVGKSDYRHALCRAQSARGFCAYLYSAAGHGESTTDLAWDGHAMIYENGALMGETKRFADAPELLTADIDLDVLAQERLRHGSFNDCAALEGRAFRLIPFRLDPPGGDLGFHRAVDRFPYVPDDDAKLDELCFEAYNIQVAGLVKRLEASGIERVVIGISGGLDSTQALLVAAQAMDRLGRPRTDILAYTLPGFATSTATKTAAWDLMRALGVTAEEISIDAASRQMLADIAHPHREGASVHDVTYENVQAGARTSLLFRLANLKGGLVLGTGDLSELALGWCTYGVGDQMSHYNVNGSVSKTLIQHLIRWVAASDRFGETASAVLLRILDTEISPELVPGDGETPGQKTEEIVGPYELQDFNLFWVSRHGLRPSKIAFLAWHAWRDREAGAWPPHMRAEKRNEYDLATIRKWLRAFLWRFFQTSQFKRSAMPNGPKVASGGSLSPRGDWRAPSDGVAAPWIAELEENCPEEI